MTIKHFMDFMNHKRPADIKEVEIMAELNFGDIPVLDYADAKVLVDDDDNVYAIGGVQEVVEDDYKLNIVCVALIRLSSIKSLFSVLLRNCWLCILTNTPI